MSVILTSFLSGGAVVAAGGTLASIVVGFYGARRARAAMSKAEVARENVTLVRNLHVLPKGDQVAASKAWSEWVALLVSGSPSDEVDALGLVRVAISMALSDDPEQAQLGGATLRVISEQKELEPAVREAVDSAIELIEVTAKPAETKPQAG